MMKPTRTILISGAGIAGPALAFWLHRFGFEATIVEHAPALRTGGHAVDFRGVSMDVLQRMGLLDEVRAVATHMGDMHYVDESGRSVARLPASFASGELEILRGDLSRIFHAATADDVGYIFGDGIAALAEDADGVAVSFQSGRTGHYDLVIGADGLHSAVRKLAFGPEQQFLRHLGLYLAVATIPNFLDLDYDGRMFNAPGTIASIYSARQNTEARAIFFFHAPALDYNHRDMAEQKAIVASRYAGQGWVVPQLIEAMRQADDFYFYPVSQTCMDRWSRGRVALLGDAAFCATPLSGMGTGMAVTGAYMLARALRDAGGDYAAAFAHYEAGMRPFVVASQKLAQMGTRGYVPQTRLGIKASRFFTRLFNFLPPRVIVKPATDAANSIVLAD
ncbi:MAG TPA: FAD-dependent monooxygenase [Devosiaceae bacterium]